MRKFMFFISTLMCISLNSVAENKTKVTNSVELSNPSVQSGITRYGHNKYYVEIQGRQVRMDSTTYVRYNRHETTLTLVERTDTASGRKSYYIVPTTKAVVKRSPSKKSNAIDFSKLK